MSRPALSLFSLGYLVTIVRNHSCINALDVVDGDFGKGGSCPMNVVSDFSHPRV